MQTFTIARHWFLCFTFLCFSIATYHAGAQCTGTASFTVTTPACKGSVLTFSASNSPDSTYWDFGDGTTNLVSGSSKSHTYASSGSFNVKLVRIFNHTGISRCKDSVTTSVTVYPTTKPKASFSFSPNTTQCMGTTITFTNNSTVNSPSTATYLWDFNDGTTSTSNSPTHQFTSYGTSTKNFAVKLSVTDNGGCSTHDTTMTVTVKQAPEPDLDDSCNPFTPFKTCTSKSSSPSFTVCPLNNSTNYTSFSIDWGDGTSSYSGTSFSSTSHTYTKLGVFNLKYTVTGSNGCSATKTYQVINESNPSVGISSPGSTAGCSPQSYWFKLNATNVSPTTSFIWDFGDGSSTVTWDYTRSKDSILHTFTKSSCGNTPAGGSCSDCFVVKVKATNACNTTTATVDNIKITVKPKAGFNASTSSPCAGVTSVSFTNTTIEDACTGSTLYNWNFGDGGTSTQKNPSHTFNRAGTFNVRLVAKNACGNDTLIKPITVDTIPVAKFTHSLNPSTGCGPLTVSYTNTTTSTTATWSWSVSPGTGVSFVSSTSSSSKNPVIQLSTAGTFYITLRASNGCGYTTWTDTILVKTKPVVTLSTIPNGCVSYIINPTATFSNGGSAITSYSWSFTGGSPSGSSSQSPGQVTYATAGSYTVSVTATNACGSTTVSQNFTVNSLPAANTGGSAKSICLGQSTSIGGTAVSGSTYAWTSKPAGYTNSTANPTVTPNTTTTYYLTETNSAGCKKTDSIKVTVNPLPNASVGSPKSICGGDSTQLGGSAVSGNTYAWTSKPAGFTSSSSNPFVKPTVTTTYYLTETITSTGCNKKDSVKITVSPLPTPSISGTLSVCEKSSQSYSTPSTAGSGYKWTVGGGTITSGAGTRSVTVLWGAAGSGSLKVVETNGTGCKDSSTQSVTINALPSVSAGRDTTICKGSTVSLGKSSVSGHTYSWSSSPAGFSSASANPSVAPATTTTYYLTETITATGCQNKDTVIVTVNPLPNATVGSAKAICAGDSTQLGGTAVSGNSYSWTSNPAGFTSSLSSPWVKPTVTTTYYLTETVNATGCKKQDSVKVTVTSKPSAPTASNNGPKCAGQSLTLSASTVSGAAYSWTGPNSFSSTQQNPVINNITTSQAGSYSVKVTVNGCSSSTSTTNVTINPAPSANAGSAKAICVGDSTQIGSTSVSGNSYSWTSRPTGFTSSLSNPYVKPTVTTTYYLTETITSSGCAKTDSVKVTINPLPTANAGSGTAICSGKSTNIGATAVSGHTYSWTSKPAGFTSTSANPTVSPVTTTTYYLTETITATGCTKSDSVKITVNPVPATPSISGNSSVCEKSSQNYSVTNHSGNTYQWTVSGGSISSGAGTNAISVSWGNSGTGSVKVVESNSYGCKDSSTKNTTINPLPAATTGTSRAICYGQSTTIGSTSQSGHTYSWTSKPAGFTSAASNPSVSPTVTTTYYLTESITSTGCSKSDSITITVNPLPSTPNINGNTSVCANASQGYTSTNNSSSSGYQWTVTGGSITSGGSTNSVTVLWGSAGTGTIKVVVTNGPGCKDSFSKNITINPLPSANPGSAKTICYAQSTTIGSTAVSGNTYSWTSRPAGFTSTSASPTVSPTATTKYYLTETITATGCYKTDSVLVTVNPLPTVSAGSNDTFCNTSITATLTGYSPTGGTWKGKGITSAGVFTPSTAGVGTHTMTYTYTNSNGCTDSATKKIVVINPTNAYAGVNDTVCVDAGAYLLRGFTPSGGTWSGTGVSSSGTFTPSTAGAGTHLLTYTYGTGTCKTTSTKVVKVNPLPTVSAGTNETWCISKPAYDLSGQSPTGGWWKGTGITDSAKGSFDPSKAGSGSFILTYYYKDPSTRCVNTSTKTIRINPLPAVVAGPADTFCNTSITATLTGFSPSGGVWKGKGITTAGVFTPSLAGTGTHTLYYVYTNSNGCSDSGKKTILVVNPVTPKAGPNDTVCISDADYPLSGYTPAGGSWSGTGVTSAGVFSPSKAGAGIFTLTYTYGTGTCKVSATKSVKVNPLPTVSAGNGITTCLNEPAIQLSGFSPTGGTWTGTGITDSKKGIFDPKKAGQGTFWLKYSYQDPGTHCYNYDSIQAKVMPLPKMAFTADTFQCKGTTVSITNSTTGATTYSWDFGDGFTSTLATPAHSYTAIGRYTIRLVAISAAGCKDTLKQSIRIGEPPVAGFSRTPANGPGPLTVNFTNKSTGEIKNYFWDLGNGMSSTSANPGVINYQQSDNGDTTYYITLKVSNVCGSSIWRDSVKVFPRPKARFGTDKNTGCSPLTIQFSNKSVGKPTSLFWDFGNGKTSTAVNPPAQVYTTDTLPRKYTITLIASNKYGTDTARWTITVYPNTVHAFFNASVQSGCGPLTVQFRDFSRGGTFISWDLGDSTLSGVADPIHTYTKAGTYLVQQFVNNGCSFDTARKTIIVHPQPLVKFSSLPACAGDSLFFTNLSQDASSYHWDFGDPASAGADTSTLTNPKHIYRQPGKYLVTLSAVSKTYGCISKYSDSVEVYTLPWADFAPNPEDGCRPLKVSFNNLSTGAAYYRWDFGDGNTSILPSPTHIFRDSGLWYVHLTAISVIGCQREMIRPVHVYPYPQSRFTYAPGSGCDTATTVYFKNASTGATGYLWDFGNGRTSTANNPSQRYDSAGNYTIRLISTNAFGCADTFSDRFHIYRKPQPAFTADPLIGCQPQLVRFNNQTKYANSYSWDFGDGSSSIIDNPIHLYANPGTYTVRLLAQGDGICADSIVKTKLIRINPKPKAGFTYSIRTNPITGEVDFTNRSTGAIRYFWDFGDGITSTDANPKHRYALFGDYNIKQVVITTDGCTDTLIQSLHIDFFKGLYVPNTLIVGSGPDGAQIFLPKGAGLKSYRLQIFNAWGELLWESDKLKDGQPAEGWPGTYHDKPLPQDVYVWKIQATFLDGEEWQGVDNGGTYRKTGSVTLLK